ncbi:type VI secretion system-associated FHA domain protein TagH [Pseudomonas sp. AF32]|uniref:type VI secretion system-associated FHA domain protein TagH n=1 Tax=Pseudomonas sp. AF32 TaxID=554390 RepID=UPI001EEF5237|nr:type VI secretion system-associated FHA domain protein TagH [Pseudomonas sp. AF32]MCG6574384.1 type VI secretion system-associated FHA domain protein TagH [Pseudomonas sp. AF32]
MELVLEVLNARQFIAAPLCRKRFGPEGGVLGRGEGCDWVIPDRQRLLSKRHAQISAREEAFFLTDTSGNGVSHRDSGARLPKGEPVRIQDGDVYLMGDFEILARLVSGRSSTAEAGRPLSTDSLIPDDAFSHLDPLKMLDQEAHGPAHTDDLINPTTMPAGNCEWSGSASIDRENLLLPELVEAPDQSMPGPLPPDAAFDHPADEFWERFGIALGMDLGNLDDKARETLAINAARLIGQSLRLGRDFTEAYDEQVRSISVQHSDHHG